MIKTERAEIRHMTQPIIVQNKSTQVNTVTTNKEINQNKQIFSYATDGAVNCI